MVVGVVLMVLGVGAAGWGVMNLFNLRGTVDKAVERRNAVRAVTAARTMELGLAQPSRIGGWFFRLLGGVLLPCGLFLGFIGLALTFAE